MSAITDADIAASEALAAYDRFITSGVLGRAMESARIASAQLASLPGVAPSAEYVEARDAERIASSALRIAESTDADLADEVWARARDAGWMTEGMARPCRPG